MRSSSMAFFESIDEIELRLEAAEGRQGGQHDGVLRHEVTSRPTRAPPRRDGATRTCGSRTGHCWWLGSPGWKRERFLALNLGFIFTSNSFRFKLRKARRHALRRLLPVGTTTAERNGRDAVGETARLPDAL